MTVIAFHWWDIIPIMILATVVVVAVMVWRATHQ